MSPDNWRSEDARCVAEISEPPHYIHHHVCGRPRKNHVNEPVPLCGIHMRTSGVWVTFPSGAKEFVKR